MRLSPATLLLSIAVTTDQLVGAQEFSDISIFCGHSFTREAGRVNATCGENAPNVTWRCDHD